MSTEVYAYPERDISSISRMYIPREIYNRRYDPFPSTIFKIDPFVLPLPSLYTVLYHRILNSETDLRYFRIINKLRRILNGGARARMWYTIVCIYIHRVKRLFTNVHLSLPTMFINQSLRFYYALIFVFNMRAKIFNDERKIQQILSFFPLFFFSLFFFQSR